MSSSQTSGCARMKVVSRSTQSDESRSMTSTPRSRNQSIPPWNVRDSPTTTLPIRNCTINPQQYQHGANVGTKRVPSFALQNLTINPAQSQQGSNVVTMMVSWYLR